MRSISEKITASKQYLPGFTMIELLVVVTIMVVLSVIGLVSFQSTSRNARNAKRKADMESVRSALVLYRSDKGTYPPFAGGQPEDFEDALEELYQEDYYSNATLSDPKGGTYQYTYDSNGVIFELCATLESDQSQKSESAENDYCLANP